MIFLTAPLTAVEAPVAILAGCPKRAAEGASVSSSVGGECAVGDAITMFPFCMGNPFAPRASTSVRRLGVLKVRGGACSAAGGLAAIATAAKADLSNGEASFLRAAKSGLVFGGEKAALRSTGPPGVRILVSCSACRSGLAVRGRALLGRMFKRVNDNVRGNGGVAVGIRTTLS